MDVAGKFAAILGITASIAVGATMDKYPGIEPIGEPVIVALCLSAVLKGARPLQARSKIFSNDRSLLSRDPTYISLMSDHRRWNTLSIAGLVGVAAARFEFNPLLAIPGAIVCLILGYSIIDRAVGWKAQ